MAGFIDKNNRIIDMVLTSYGRKLLSRGELRFCYWIPYDDEINYSPYITSGAFMSPETLSSSIYQSIETTPVREATTGYKSLSLIADDRTNVNNPMFSIPHGQRNLPRAIFPDSQTKTIGTKQRKVTKVFVDSDQNGNLSASLRNADIGIERFNSTLVSLEMLYTKNSFPLDYRPDGFHIRVLRSGSSGLTELRPRRDMNNDIAFSSDLRAFTGDGGGD